MTIYSISSFRVAFDEALNNMTLEKNIRKSVRISFFEFIKVQSIFNMGIIKKAYIAYDSSFYVDEDIRDQIIDVIFDKFGVSIKSLTPPTQVDTVVIDNIKDFQDLINKSKVLMSNPNIQIKKNEVKEVEKSLTKERMALINKLSQPLPKTLDGKKFMTIDFEYDQNKNYRVSECGLTFYFNGQMTHEHYVVEENYKDKRNYDLQFQFKFGITQIVSMAELMAILTEKLKHIDYIVGHCILSEYLVMKFHGLNFLTFKHITALDTQEIFKAKFNCDIKQKNLSLGNLLAQFSIEHEHLHNAGNDAAYTMIALLQMQKYFSGKNSSRIRKINLSLTAAA